MITKLPVLAASPVLEELECGISVLLPYNEYSPEKPAINCTNTTVTTSYDGDFLQGLSFTDAATNTTVAFTMVNSGIRAVVSTGGDYRCEAPDAIMSLLFMVSILSTVFPVVVPQSTRQGLTAEQLGLMRGDTYSRIKAKHYIIGDKQTTDE